jgi:hypothetical protein
MNLTEFTWNSQVLGPKELLGAIETAIPAATIDKAIEPTFGRLIDRGNNIFDNWE